MANPLLDLLPSDATTLKNILAWAGPSWVASLFLLWTAARHYYKDRIETAQQLVAATNAQSQQLLAIANTHLAECKDKLRAAEPGQYLQALKDHQAFVSETSGVRIKALEEQVSQAEARIQAIAVERDSAVATVHQRQDQAAELARLRQEKAVAEARIQELWGSIEQAHQLAEGIQAAALRQARKEQQEYEANKDTLRHRFVKRVDARAEFEQLREHGTSEGRIPAEPEPKVQFIDHGAGGVWTIVDVIGHDWYVYLRGREGWYFFTPSADDHVTAGVKEWAKAYARILAENRNLDVGGMQTLGRDFIEMHVNDRAGVRHSLSVLATIKGGYPTPMALYLSGLQTEVESGFRRWRREHGTGMTP